MATNRNSGVHFEGPGDRIIHDLIRDRRRRTVVLRDVLRGWGNFGEDAVRRHAPVGKHPQNRPQPKLHELIGSSSVIYSPGEAGGGGRYSKIVGVRASSSLHPIYVHEGTAHAPGVNAQNFSKVNLVMTQDQGRIYPIRAKALKLPPREEGGTGSYRRSVRGQRPNPYVYHGYLDTVVYARAQLRAVARAAGFR